MYYRESHYQGHHHRFRISSVLAAIVAAAGGVVTVLLGVRFVLSALQVDRLTEPASVIYSASFPFVAPFFGLFNYQQQMGVVRFEYQTVAAIVFWALAAWLLAWLITGSTNEE